MGHRFSRSKDIWRFLPIKREIEYQAFMKEYRTVREAEHWGGATPRYYRALPRVGIRDPHRGIWRIREKSFGRLLAEVGKERVLKILDSGAGNCWLSNQMAERGHNVAAVDLCEDARDGLGAKVNYGNEFECYQAEFGRLPFRPMQFDVVVFNASLHYADSLLQTLCEAKRVLAASGKIIVLDSPFYPDEASGVAAIQAREEYFERRFHFNRKVSNVGFLTRPQLDRAATELGLDLRIRQGRESWDERLRRAWAGRKAQREPARFPLVVFEA